jgi:hypothetical protein
LLEKRRWGGDRLRVSARQGFSVGEADRVVATTSSETRCCRA